MQLSPGPADRNHIPMTFWLRNIGVIFYFLPFIFPSQNYSPRQTFILVKRTRYLIGWFDRLISIDSRNCIHLSDVFWCNILTYFAVFCFYFCLCICSKSFFFMFTLLANQRLEALGLSERRNISSKFRLRDMLINYNFLNIFQIYFCTVFRFS